MQRDLPKAILSRGNAGDTVTLMDWVRGVQTQKHIVFLQLNDDSCLADQLWR